MLKTSGPFIPASDDDDDNVDECGAVDGTIFGRGNRSVRRKHARVPLSPLKIPYLPTWDQTRAAVVRPQLWHDRT
jgi:hypothetical protein